MSSSSDEENLEELEQLRQKLATKQEQSKQRRESASSSTRVSGVVPASSVSTPNTSNTAPAIRGSQVRPLSITKPPPPPQVLLVGRVEEAAPPTASVQNSNPFLPNVIRPITLSNSTTTLAISSSTTLSLPTVIRSGPTTRSATQAHVTDPPTNSLSAQNAVAEGGPVREGESALPNAESDGKRKRARTRSTTQVCVSSPTNSSSSENEVLEDEPAKKERRNSIMSAGKVHIPARLPATTSAQETGKSRRGGQIDVAITESVVKTLHSVISGVWRISPSFLSIIKSIVWIFQAPLITVMHVTLSMLIIAALLSAMLWSVCQSEYLQFLSVCHATEKSPLCAIPYSSSLLVFCPIYPFPAIDVSTFVEPAYQYAYGHKVSESHRNLAFVLADYRSEMRHRAIDLVTSKHPTAVDLSRDVRQHTKALAPAIKSFRSLNHRVFILEVKMRIHLAYLLEQMEKHEQRSRLLYISSADPFLALLGIHRVSPYAQLWLDFLAVVNETATELRGHAATAQGHFAGLNEQHSRLIERSTVLYKEQVAVLGSYWGPPSWLWRRQEIEDLKDVVESLGRVRDACAQGARVVDLVWAITEGMVSSAEDLSNELRKGEGSGGGEIKGVGTKEKRMVGASTLKAQIETVKELVDQMVEAKRNSDESRAADLKVWEKIANVA